MRPFAFGSEMLSGCASSSCFTTATLVTAPWSSAMLSGKLSVVSRSEAAGGYVSSSNFTTAALGRGRSTAQ